MRENHFYGETVVLPMKKLYRIAGLAAFLIFMGINAVAAQQFQVKGKITDSQTGEAMPGVNIVVQGTSVGAISNADGSYTINAERNDNLSFSFIEIGRAHV